MKLVVSFIVIAIAFVALSKADSVSRDQNEIQTDDVIGKPCKCMTLQACGGREVNAK